MSSDLDLLSFFLRTFVPEEIPNSTRKQQMQYRNAINALGRHIGRPPTIADLNRENGCALLEALAALNRSYETRRRIRNRLDRLWKHAHRRGFSGPAKMPTAATPAIHKPKAPLVEGALAVLFERSFVAERLAGKHPKYATQFRSALRRFNKLVGRPAGFDDLTAANARAFLERLAAEGMPHDQLEMLAKRLRMLWRHAHRIGATSEPPMFPPLLSKARTVAPSLPSPEPGTVRHFLANVYAPQRLIDATPIGAWDYWRAVEMLYLHYGRDITLEEQSDALAADHFQWLKSRRISNVRINHGHRATWFAIWRMAFERGLVSRSPSVRKLKVSLPEPDAWTQAEMERILAAAIECVEPSEMVIAPGDFWRALVLTAWWTGLRRGTLLAIRHDDIDLATGWLTIPGEAMKNRRGKKFRLGADAIEAISRIWFPQRELLFPWPRTLKALSAAFGDVLVRAGVPSRPRRSLSKFHKLRRTVATSVAERSGIAAASELLGHSGQAVTLRYIDPTRLPGNDATKLLPALADPAMRSVAIANAGEFAGDPQFLTLAAFVDRREELLAIRALADRMLARLDGMQTLADEASRSAAPEE